MRLAELDPATVGRAATVSVLARLARLALPLAPGVSLRWEEHGDTDLGMTLAALCAWAQTGALAAWAQTGALGDWQDHEDAADALLGATEALCRAPLGDAWDAAVAEAAADDGPTDDDPVALVLAAALSRLRVCRGEAVTGAELARLASVAPSWVRALTQRGEIAAARGEGSAATRVPAAEARRWLASRGLPGW